MNGFGPNGPVTYYDQPQMIGRQTPESLTRSRSEYQKAERDLVKKLREAEFALTALTNEALIAIPKTEYVTPASDSRCRRAEQEVLLASKEPIQKARALVDELTDALAEAKDMNSDMSFFQRERTAAAVHKLNDNILRMEKTVEAFSTAVNLYVTAKNGNHLNFPGFPLPTHPLVAS